MNFLEEVNEDIQKVRPILDRNPEWQPIAAKLLQLYNDITTKAIENEKAD